MSKRTVVYQAPPAKLIDECAHHICKELGHVVGENFNTPDVVWGFAEYLKVVAAIAVKQSNEQALGESSKNTHEPVDKLE